MNKNLKLEYMDMTKPKTTCIRGADEGLWISGPPGNVGTCGRAGGDLRIRVLALVLSQSSAVQHRYFEVDLGWGVEHISISMCVYMYIQISICI